MTDRARDCKASCIKRQVKFNSIDWLGNSLFIPDPEVQLLTILARRNVFNFKTLLDRFRRRPFAGDHCVVVVWNRCIEQMNLA